MPTLCLEGGRVLCPDATIEEADVLVEQAAGEILDVGPGLSGEKTLDVTGDLVIPGLINAHTHIAMTLLRGYADDKPLDSWLQEDIWPVEAELTPEDISVGAQLGALESIKAGTTTVSDMYFDVEKIAAVIAESGLRAVLGHTAVTVGKDDAAASEDVAQSIAVARELDGQANGRITTTVQPHSLTTVEESALQALAEAAKKAELGLHFHANETTTEVEPIVAEHGERPLEFADELGLVGERSTLAHGVHVEEAEIELVAERDATVVHCPASNMKLASGIAPVQAYRDAGVTVALGTDGAASNNDLDLFDEIRDAAMVGKLAAEDARAVDAKTAVELATVGGAEALQIDSGRVEAGRNADLAVLDLDAAHLTPEHDLVSHLAYAAGGSDVRHTVCDGRVLMRDREVQTLEEAAVRDRAQSHADALLDRAE